MANLPDWLDQDHIEYCPNCGLLYWMPGYKRGHPDGRCSGCGHDLYPEVE